jgi:hypothetical protein
LLPRPSNFGTRAARASWIAPLVAVVLNCCTVVSGFRNSRESNLIVGYASYAIYIFGLIAGIVALTKLGRYGSKGILIPALIGVAINGLLVVAITILIIVSFESQ